MPEGDLRTITVMMERNIGARDVSPADIRNWLWAYRQLATFELEGAIERLIDWHNRQPTAVDPVFYLYVFYFLRWLNSSPRNSGYAKESERWLAACRRNRAIGQRTWGYEWLTKEIGGYRVIHFAELGFSPGAVLREEMGGKEDRLAVLARVEGTIIDYRGAQQATLDLGQNVGIRLTPRRAIVRQDQGKRASAFVSFTHDGMAGWDPILLKQ